jgi:transglutaminase-like putative cysteine protease
VRVGDEETSLWKEEPKARHVMRLNIIHQTTYRYAAIVSLNPHRLVVTPRNSHTLATLSKSLSFAPDADVEWMQDVFGNLIATATFSQATTELVITGEATVDQAATLWPVFRIAPNAHSYPFDYETDDALDLGSLAAPEVASRVDVAAWVRGFVRGPSTDTLSLLKDINTGMLDRVAYRPRDEERTQSAAETLAKASGSCRDIAELFIEAVRHLGFGARAISGYLYDAKASVSDRGSTHAWAEVFLPGAGWIAFDPTQRRVGEANLIPVAVARSNRQIMPVSGSYVGSPKDFIDMDVTVRVTAP